MDLASLIVPPDVENGVLPTGQPATIELGAEYLKSCTPKRDAQSDFMAKILTLKCSPTWIARMNRLDFMVLSISKHLEEQDLQVNEQSEMTVSGICLSMPEYNLR